MDYTHSNGELTISIAGHDVAILENISRSQVANTLQKIEFIGEVDTSGTENAVDILIGDDRDNRLFAIGGNDYVYGGDGKDTLLGGRGNDRQEAETFPTFFNSLFDSVAASVVDAVDSVAASVVDAVDSVAAHELFGEMPIPVDIKSYYDNNPSVNFDYTHSETDNTLTFSFSNQEVGTLENISSSQVADVLQEIEFTGEVDTTGTENATDILIGDDSDNRLFAIGGNDYVYGGDGKDTLLGGRGNDVMLGGDGDDLLRGFEQSDILIGGAGADTFGFWGYDSRSGVDTILDFTASEGDKIRIDRSDYSIDGLSDLSFNSATNELIANGTTTIAILENSSGFSVNNSNLSLV